MKLPAWFGPSLRLLLLFYLLCFTTLFTWELKGKYSVTGDEPHYLVMASTGWLK
jgi:hypothetical protein